MDTQAHIDALKAENERLNDLIQGLLGLEADKEAWCKAQKTYLARYLPKSKHQFGPLFRNGGDRNG